MKKALPEVSVLIATYNEELAVLEKSVVSALALDYPKFTVHRDERCLGVRQPIVVIAGLSVDVIRAGDVVGADPLSEFFDPFAVAIFEHMHRASSRAAQPLRDRLGECGRASASRAAGTPKFQR